MLVEACMATTWARLADKRGRRWAILVRFQRHAHRHAPLGIQRSRLHVVFLPSHAVSPMPAIKSSDLVGLTSVGVLVKICANDLAHPRRGHGFSLPCLPHSAWGFLVGTFLGGELTHPFGRLPWWLGGTSTLFRDHPYALPCLAVFGLSVAREN